MWKQCKIANGVDYLPFFNAMEQIMVESGGPKDFALLARRTDEPGVEVLALSPVAAKFGHLLQNSVWEDLPNPQDYGWSILIADASVHERFGLRRPKFGDPGV